MITKQCSRCKEIKDISYFRKSSVYKDGYFCWCRTCASEYMSERRRKNINNCRVKGNELTKIWRKNNPEKVRAQKDRNRKKHPEKFAIRSKHYRDKNKEKISEKNKLWRINNLDKFREYSKKWASLNPDKVKSSSANYYQQNKKMIMDKHNVWCKKKYEKDYVYRLNVNISSLIRISLKGNKCGLHWETLVGYSLHGLKAHLEKLFKPGMSWDNYGKWHTDHIIPISLWRFSSYKDREFKQCWALCNLQPLWAEENLKKKNKIQY